MKHCSIALNVGIKRSVFSPPKSVPGGKTMPSCDPARMYRDLHVLQFKQLAKKPIAELLQVNMRMPMKVALVWRNRQWISDCEVTTSVMTKDQGCESPQPFGPAGIPQ